MKKLLVGLLALGSISAFASDCTVSFRSHSRHLQCQGCLGTFYARYDLKLRLALISLGYNISDDETARFQFDIVNTDFKEDPSDPNSDGDFPKSYAYVQVRLRDSNTGEKWESVGSTSNRLGITPNLEDRAMTRAVRGLPKCE